MLLWIENALSPQEIRNKILDTSSDFQQRLVQYLEAVHQGECTKGTVTEVKERIDKRAQSDSYYQDPTKTLPVPPPSSCQNSNCTGDCFQCMELKNWWSSIYSETLDDLIIRSNRHTCTKPIENDNGKQEVHKACLNKKGKCKAIISNCTGTQSLVCPGILPTLTTVQCGSISTTPEEVLIFKTSSVSHLCLEGGVFRLLRRRRFLACLSVSAAGGGDIVLMRSPAPSVAYHVPSVANPTMSTITATMHRAVKAMLSLLPPASPLPRVSRARILRVVSIVASPTDPTRPNAVSGSHVSIINGFGNATTMPRSIRFFLDRNLSLIPPPLQSSGNKSAEKALTKFSSDLVNG